MTYRGRIQDGVVVFDGAEKPADGTLVIIETVELAAKQPPATGLLKWAGKLQGLPPDASLNLDHYLSGLPKK